MRNIKPKVAWLTTNRTCNNQCKWCYTLDYECNNKIMDYEKVIDTINELSSIGIKKIILIGGEPTINPNIVSIIQYINSLNIQVSMATNGRRFSDEDFTIECKKAGLTFANISVKGINEEEYLQNTNSIGFNEMISGYRNLRKHNIKASLSYVITKDDNEEFINLKNMLNNKKIDYVYFLLYKPSIETQFDYEGPSIAELASACKTAYSIFNNSGIKIKFEMSIPLCLLEEKFLQELINQNMIATCCHITKGNGIVFDTDFNILPCNHFVNHPLNDRRDQIKSIETFWNSPKCQKFRKIIRTYPAEKCQSCDKWSVCGGGCTIRWLKEDPKIIINKAN